MQSATRFNTPAAVPRTLQMGEHTLTAIPDGTVQLDPQQWLPASTPADWMDREPSVLDGRGYIAASVAALLVQYRGRALLIDTGFGPHSIPADRTIPPIGALLGGWLPASLDKVGCDPAAIDTVAFTHLHDDHTGWAFSGGPGGGSLFPAATFVASKAEWATWSKAPANVSTAVAASGAEIFPGVTALPTPGHTPGHTGYVVSTGGGRVIAFGDTFHTPAQLANPSWTVAVDALPAQGVASRLRMLKELSQPDTVGFANHFADVHFGRLGHVDGRPSWEPLDTTG